MKGDFSRIGFDATKHFSSVLLQQGRVTLDADPNEQTAILLHYVRTLARDILGPGAGPSDSPGFEVTLDRTDANQPVLNISKGRYYVDGILVEIDDDVDYAHQPAWTAPEDDPLLERLTSRAGDDFWLYADVWERHITWIEDDSIRESALGGPDTSTRTKVMWRVRAIARAAILENLKRRLDELEQRLKNTPPDDTAEINLLNAQIGVLEQDIERLTPNANGGAGTDCTAPLDGLDGLSDAQMTARLDPGQQIKDACTIAPDALYRGPENQLYRVEIHQGSDAPGGPTLKWSRDNGSLATRWLDTDGNDVVVTSTRGVSAGAWIELSDETNDIAGSPGTLVKVASVAGDRLRIDPSTIPSTGIAFLPSLVHPKVRRWDQTENDDVTLDAGAVPLVEATATQANWLTLEDGIQVQFAAGGTYRTGDYWVIPARVATGSIIWPTTVGSQGNVEWLPKPPDGVEHHYAPLAFVADNSDHNLVVTSCRCDIATVGDCGPARRLAVGATGDVAVAKRARARTAKK